MPPEFAVDTTAPVAAAQVVAASAADRRAVALLLAEVGRSTAAGLLPLRSAEALLRFAAAWTPVLDRLAERESDLAIALRAAARRYEDTEVSLAAEPG